MFVVKAIVIELIFRVMDLQIILKYNFEAILFIKYSQIHRIYFCPSTMTLTFNFGCLQVSIYSIIWLYHFYFCSLAQHKQRTTDILTRTMSLHKGRGIKTQQTVTRMINTNLNSTHMCDIQVNKNACNSNRRHANPLPAEPVTMLHFVRVAVGVKAVVERLLQGPFREQAQPTTDTATIYGGHMCDNCLTNFRDTHT